MRKEQVLSRMREECLIAVIRAKNPEQGEKIVEAVIAGGIHFIEITMTMDEGNPVEFISAMAEKYRNAYAGCRNGDFIAPENFFGFKNHFVFFGRVSVCVEIAYCWDYVRENFPRKNFRRNAVQTVYKIDEPAPSRAAYRLKSRVGNSF